MKKIFLILALLLLASPAFAVDQWSTAIPLSTSNVSDFPAQSLSNFNALDRLVSYYREGQAITYKDASTVTVGAGEISCTNSSTGVHVFRQNPSSTDVTFANLDTGSEAASTTYYVYANCDASATTNTYVISANATTPTGVTSFRLLGSIYNDSTSSITTVSNINNYYAPGIGAPASKTVGATYQALTDGVFTCFSVCTNAGGNSKRYAGYTDSSSTPTTPMGYYSAGYFDGEYNDGNFSFPVVKGNYYKSTETVVMDTGGISTSCYFIPTGN